MMERRRVKSPWIAMLILYYTHRCEAKVKDECILCPDNNITQLDRPSWYAYHRYNLTLSCASWDHYVARHYEANSNACYLVQQSSWECGCDSGFYGYLGTETIVQQRALIWVGRVTGLLSLMGASFIWRDYYKSPKKTVYRQLMAVLATFDAITAFAWIWGPFPIPEGVDSAQIQGARGTEEMCTAQGFAVALGFGSIWMYVALSLNYYLVVVRNWRDQDLDKARPWLLGVPIIVTIVIACIGIPEYDHVWTGCYLQTYPYATTRHALYLSTLPIAVAFLCCITLQVLVYRKVRKTLRRSSKWTFAAATCDVGSLDGDSIDNVRPALARRQSDVILGADIETAPPTRGRFGPLRNASDHSLENMESGSLESCDAESTGSFEYPWSKSVDSMDDGKDYCIRPDLVEKSSDRALDDSDKSQGMRARLVRRPSEHDLHTTAKNEESSRPALFRSASDRGSQCPTREDGRRPGLMRRSSERTLWRDEPCDPPSSVKRRSSMSSRPGLSGWSSDKSLNMKGNNEGEVISVARPGMVQFFSDRDPITSAMAKHGSERPAMVRPAMTRWSSDRILVSSAKAKREFPGLSRGWTSNRSLDGRSAHSARRMSERSQGAHTRENVRPGLARWMSDRTLLSRARQRKTRSSQLEASVFWQSICYLGSFCICWPMVGITGFYAADQSWGFWLVIAMIAPLQGFLDCCIYFRPRIIRWSTRQYKRRESSKHDEREETAPPGKRRGGGGGGGARDLVPSVPVGRAISHTEESYFVTPLPGNQKCDMDRLEAVSEEAIHFRDSGVSNLHDSGDVMTLPERIIVQPFYNDNVQKQRMICSKSNCVEVLG